MKHKILKHVSLLLSVLICLSSFTPVLANGTYSISMTSPTAPYSDQDQTVTLEVKLSQSVSFSTILYKLAIPADFTLESASIGSTAIALGNSEIIGDRIYTIDCSGTFNTDSIGTFVIRIPGGTPKGSYSILISDADAVGNGAYLFENLTAETTLTITEAASEPSNPSGYTASISAPTSATVGDTLSFPITVSGGSFSSAQLKMTYDAARLKFTGISAGTAVDNSGNISVAHFGEANSVPFTYTATFAALASGTATVTLTDAAFGTDSSAEIGDLTAATITAFSASVTIAEREFKVTLPNIFEGNSSVVEGQDYTFMPADDVHYTYSGVTATMNGTAVTVTENNDGSYTIKNVTGVLVITGSRSPNQYKVTFATSTDVALPNDGIAIYLVDYTFTLPTEDNYAISVTSIKIGSQNVPFSQQDGQVTIAGSEITGALTITLDKVRTNAAVTVEGSGTSDLTASPLAVPGTDFSVILSQDSRYDYQVTATVNGTAVTLVTNGNTYTIPGESVKAGTIVFTVTKTLKTENFSFSKYVQLNGTAAWLILNTVEQQSSSVYTYDGNDMFWSDKYEAYCYLVVASSSDGILASNLGLRSGSAAEVDYGMDVNKSGKVDANDAQLTYNLYNAKYNGFTETVTMEKFLRADVNGDETVNVTDANQIIHTILNP